jgi:hypothetical protein
MICKGTIFWCFIVTFACFDIKSTSMSYSRNIFPLIILVLAVFQFSCRKQDKIDTTPGLTLSFSTDTVFFDTVFPTVGSVTKRLIVYNPNDNKVSVSKIRISGGSASSYRINVDGIAGTEFSQLEIPGKDSIFVFIKVNVNPQNADLPFVVSDSIQFETNGSQQYVKLVAWGREARFYRDVVISETQVWDSLRAHVIYGSIRIDTGASLTVLAGTRIYFHYGAYMAVSYQGNLKISGTIDHPVKIQGDRMDPFYRDLTGQWSGIFLDKGSVNHQIDNAIIKNGVYGMVVDQPEQSSQTMLTINNTIIQNMTGSGLYARGTNIKATNFVIADCGRSCIEIIYGGSYDFKHLTIGNYWYSSVRKAPSVYLSNYDYDTSGVKITNPLTNAYFGNTIIYGGNDEEIELDSVAGVQFMYIFDHALLKTELAVTNPLHYENCMKNQDPVFVDIQESNYQIDSISPAIDKGKEMGIPFDLLGVSRSNPPDLGAYEYRKKR